MDSCYAYSLVLTNCIWCQFWSHGYEVCRPFHMKNGPLGKQNAWHHTSSTDRQLCSVTVCTLSEHPWKSGDDNTLSPHETFWRVLCSLGCNPTWYQFEEYRLLEWDTIILFQFKSFLQKSVNSDQTLQCHIQRIIILHSHYYEYLKSHTMYLCFDLYSLNLWSWLPVVPFLELLHITWT
jgi:hypothetical protein